jgi:MFS family permease
LALFNRIIHIPLRLFHSAVPVPEGNRSIFRYLYTEIGWYGVLSGTILSFISIFLARIGANGTQIGMINAAPAVIGLVFTLPIGQWLQHRSLTQTVFLSSIAQRVFYFFLIFLPVLLPHQGQIWMIVLLTLILSIPGTAVTIGFNSMFADLVPVPWRGYVAGIRNALLSIASTLTTLLSGWILVALPFPLGYQIVFGFGFLGGMLSSLFLFLIAAHSTPSGIKVEPWRWLFPRSSEKEQHNPRSLLFSPPRMDILRSPFGKILGLLFFFHLFQYLAVPLFPLYWVNEVKFGDQVIGLGQAILSVAVFVGSTQLDRISRRLGNHRLLGFGILAMSLYPILTGFMRDIPLFILSVILGGLAWSMVSGVLFNYIYEKIPGDERAAYLSWYFLIFNAAVLIGSLGGPFIAQTENLSFGLILFGCLRLAAGAAILIWG